MCLCPASAFGSTMLKWLASVFLFIYCFSFNFTMVISFDKFLLCFRLSTQKHMLVSLKWNLPLLPVARMLLSHLVFITSIIVDRLKKKKQLKNFFFSNACIIIFLRTKIFWMLGSTPLLKLWNMKKLCGLLMLWKFLASIILFFVFAWGLFLLCFHLTLNIMTNHDFFVLTMRIW